MSFAVPHEHVRISLIGYRGTGKTAVAAALALRQNAACTDADVVLEARAGKTIAQIFADDGEAAFRELEAALVPELLSGPQTIVAWGGGVVLRAANRELLRQHSHVIWLRAEPATIWQRLQQDPSTATRRPNLTATGGQAEIEWVLAQRHDAYAQCAHRELATDGLTPDEIALRIETWVRAAPAPPLS